MLSKINGATGAPKQEESNMQKNISLIFIAVMSFVISVLVMGFLNVYFDKNIAMLYVVIEELIPEASTGEHSNMSTVGFALGFVLMMTLDVVLG